MDNWYTDDDGTVVLKIKSWDDKPNIKTKNTGVYADGDPDYFKIYNNNECLASFDNTNENAYPFIIANGKILIGRNASSHRNMGGERYKKYDDFSSGRVWVNTHFSNNETHTVITFWWASYGSLNIDGKLVEKLLNKLGADKNNVLVVSFEDEDFGTVYQYNDWKFSIPEASDEQRKIYATHLMNAHDKHNATDGFRKTRDRLIGKKLTNDNGVEMPEAQYKSMIYGEGKKVENIIRNVLKEYIYKDRKIIIF